MFVASSLRLQFVRRARLMAGSGPTVATPTQAAITGTNAEVWAECNGLAGAGVTARTAESVAPGIGGVVAGTNAASDGLPAGSPRDSPTDTGGTEKHVT